MTDIERRALLEILAAMEAAATRREIHRLRRLWFSAIRIAMGERAGRR